MQAYELLAHLRHLTLAGKDEEGYEWIGRREQWERVSDEIFAFEVAESFGI